MRNRFLGALRERSEPVVIAHRGDSFRAPENTLEAARLAHQAGAAAWELDVQITSDGVPVVLHDDSLVRTTDVARRFPRDGRAQSGFHIGDFTFEEIRSLDAGWWFVDEQGGPRSARSFGTFELLGASAIDLYRSGRVRIPSLKEALTLTHELDWLVNVEIKSFPSHPPGLVERVLDVVAETQTASRVLISSFDHTDVSRAKHPDREYALGILTSIPLQCTADYVIGLVGAETAHISAEVIGAQSVEYRRNPQARSLRWDLVEELNARGVPMLVYTVNDSGPGSLARHLAELGIAGLFTDNPRGLAEKGSGTVSR
jgi:glycerophosphoryl diester phosphodiesterase